MSGWYEQDERGPQGQRLGAIAAVWMRTPSRAAALGCIGAATLLLGLAALPEPFGLAHVLCVAGSLFVLAGMSLPPVAAFGAAGGRETADEASPKLDVGRLDRLADRLEDRIEALEDVRWEISENEARYRELLDAQGDIILKIDGLGRLTFVNTAFCTAFSVTPADVLGHPPAFEVVERVPVDAQDDPGHPPGDRLERIQTSQGVRWVSWRAYSLPASEDGAVETEWVGRDVTDEREAAADLSRARADAEAANRAKSRFLASMSHEIRTPMNGILGMSSLLRGTQQTPEQATYADAIEHSARTLLALIDEILDFSKIEAGKLTLECAPFSLSECVQSAVELVARRAHDKGLEIAWRVAPALPGMMVGDSARLRQVLLNLLSNAIKFTDVGGVEVTVEKAGPNATTGEGVALLIRVRDTGIGLGPQAQQSIFTEFEQIDGSARREYGGTGLGLAISRRVVRAMGGEIAVHSELGLGSTFEVRLTLACATTDAEGVGKPPTAPTDAQVLIAADRPFERRIMVAHLADAGIPAMATPLATAAEALAAARAAGRPINRLIVESTLDATTAGRLLAAARAASRGDDVAGIVLVEPQARAGLAAYRAVGFGSYLLRPVRPATLVRELAVSAAAPGPDAYRAPGLPVADATPVDDKSDVDLRSRLILVVEDNPINELLAVKVVTSAGFACRAVRSGEAAVEHMRQAIAGAARLPALILMDICMPGLDGVEATAAIHRLFESEGGPRGLACPPIVALTAHAFAEDRARYLAAGLDDYLAKPFEPADLLRVVDKLAGSGSNDRSAA